MRVSQYDLSLGESFKCPAYVINIVRRWRRLSESVFSILSPIWGHFQDAVRG